MIATTQRASRRPSPPRSRRRELLSWAVTLLIAAALVAGIRASGLALVVVTTDSMQPTLMPRDYVLTVSPRVVKPEVGSVVVFTPSFAGNQLPAHIHRLVGVNPDGTWQTRGDNANGKDPWSVRPEQVKGVATGVRLPASVTRNPWTIGAGAFLLALLALWRTPRTGDELGGAEASGSRTA